MCERMRVSDGGGGGGPELRARGWHVCRRVSGVCGLGVCGCVGVRMGMGMEMEMRAGGGSALREGVLELPEWRRC